MCSCPNLFELDVSDAVRLTHRSVKSIAERLRRIESLSTSRCYSISPTAYLSLDVSSGARCIGTFAGFPQVSIIFLFLLD